jgi:hypothetical protein
MVRYISLMHPTRAIAQNSIVGCVSVSVTHRILRLKMVRYISLTHPTRAIALILAPNIKIKDGACDRTQGNIDIKAGGIITINDAMIKLN